MNDVNDWYCNIGDLVRVNGEGWEWLGVCTWTDGYKYSFVLGDMRLGYANGESEITWTTHYLSTVGAEVLA